ncbi:MAG TPA: hypothetical protein VGA17_07195 [Nitrospiraceae bacterium]
MLYEALFRGLHIARVRYLLVGAVAINLHGVPRMTADVDLMVDMADANLRTFVQTLTSLGYKPRVPVDAAEVLNPEKRREWRDTKSMIVFTWLHPARPYEEVDMFLNNPIDFGTAYANRKEVSLGDYAVPLSGISDLIALKTISGREQDRSDIEALRQIQNLTEEGSS